MKAVIHIGTPKSGTTTIQSFLALNRSALAGQGFRYQPMNPRHHAQMELGLVGMIRAGDTVDAAVKQWALGAYTEDAQKAHVDRFEAVLADGVRGWPEHTYIGSSEQVFAWLSNPARIEAFDRFLRQYFDSVRYIVYFRPQHELMLSSYSERIKRGERPSFEQHFDERSGRMNWNNRARMWARTVGRDALSIRLLDRGRMVNGDLLDDFCAAAGLDRAPLATPPRMNTSLSVEEIALYLRIGRLVPARTRRGAPNPVFFTLLRVLRLGLPKPGTRLALTDEQRAMVQQACAEPNERLRAEFFPHLPTLFSDP